MNYAQLFETIKGYVENDFPSTQFTDPTGATGTFTSKEQIDTFIEQAEQRIFNSVQFPNFRKNQTGTLSPSNQYLECASVAFWPRILWRLLTNER
jgi:hypothetical protein